MSHVLKASLVFLSVVVASLFYICRECQESLQEDDIFFGCFDIFLNVQEYFAGIVVELCGPTKPLRKLVLIRV